MAKTKAHELGGVRVTALPLLPAPRADEIPHWKVWRWTRRNPGRPCVPSSSPSSV